MTVTNRGAGDLPPRLALIATSVLAVIAFLVAVERAPHRGAAPTSPTIQDLSFVSVDPIAAEAAVFRTRAAAFAIDPGSDRTRPAHPRNLRTYRTLRAYPGAPPRIPHGFTTDEFRTGACLTCHGRGGFSPRFGAYVPVTPHPEMTACLQCHVGDDAVTGVPLPSSDPNARCRQCHALSGQRGTTPRLLWRGPAWPLVVAPGLGDAPPPIPHDLYLRGNCLACHAGPAAVTEIRSRHPERANCRQCHVTQASDEPPYERPRDAVPRAGGAP